MSDRASRGEYVDRGTPEIIEYLREVLRSPWEPVTHLVADEVPLIEAALRTCCEQACALVITTGGTGPAPRDVTPEATEAVCERLLPGFGEAMRTASLQEVSTAILSRQTAGTRGATLIVNLPGSPRAIRTCLDTVMGAVPYCVDLIGGPRLDVDPQRLDAFRPPVPDRQGG